MNNIIAVMKTNLSMYLLQSVLNALTSEKLRSFVDGILSYIESKVLGTNSKIDDNLIFPLVGALRVMLSLPPEIRIDTRTLSAITSALMGLFDIFKLKDFADKQLEFFESAIKKSETQLDDKFILPIIRAFRVSFDIPDNTPIVEKHINHPIENIGNPVTKSVENIVDIIVEKPKKYLND